MGRIIKKSDLYKWLCIALLTVSAFCMRLQYIEYGLPHQYHSDERYKIDAIINYTKGAFEPPNFYHPTFMTYSSALFLVIWKKIICPLNSYSEIAIVCRIWIAFLGAMTIPAAVIIGWRNFSFSAGILAGIFLSLSPMHLICSHYVKEDISLVFWMMPAVYFILEFIKTRKIWHLILGGILGGFAGGSKYVGLLFIPIFFCVALFTTTVQYKEKRREFLLKKCPKYLLLFFVMVIIGFLIVTPYSLLTPKFKEGVKGEVIHNEVGHDDFKMSAWKSLWTFHLRKSLIPSMTPPLFILCALGFLFILKTKNQASQIIGISALLIYFLVESSNLKPPPNYERYVLPIIPLLSLLGGDFVSAIYKNRKSILAKSATGAVVLFVIFYMIYSDLNFINSLKTDTRVAAGRWIYKNFPKDSKIFFLAYPPYHADVSDMNYKIEFGFPNDPVELNKYDYIVASSLHYERYYTLYNVPLPRRAVYDYVFNRFRLLRDIKANTPTTVYHNPEIRIYGVMR